MGVRSVKKLVDSNAPVCNKVYPNPEKDKSKQINDEECKQAAENVTHRYEN